LRVQPRPAVEEDVMAKAGISICVGCGTNPEIWPAFFLTAVGAGA